MALEPVAVWTDRVLPPTEAHPAGPTLALALTSALAEAGKDLLELLVTGVDQEGSGLTLALALAFALEHAPNPSGRFVPVEAPPAGLGMGVCPKQMLGLHGRREVLDVGVVVLAIPERTRGVGVRP
jgi:hypothetical protein